MERKVYSYPNCRVGGETNGPLEILILTTTDYFKILQHKQEFIIMSVVRTLGLES